MTAHLGKPFTSQELWITLLKYLTPVSYANSDNSDSGRKDVNLRNRLRADFVRNNQNTYNKISDAIDANDIEMAHRLAHTLKGVAALIGKNTLSKAALDVEQSLKNGKNQTTKEQLGILKTELYIVLDELKPYLIESTSENPADVSADDIDVNFVRELYDKLEPLIRRGSPKCTQFVNQLRKIPGTETLIREIEDFNFTEAATILGFLKNDSEGK